MEFEFDPDKAAENLKKHSVPFSGAEGLFADPPAAHRPDRRGTTSGGRIHPARREGPSDPGAPGNQAGG
jgi:uncharacterized DUF497 family protein